MLITPAIEARARTAARLGHRQRQLDLHGHRSTYSDDQRAQRWKTGTEVVDPPALELIAFGSPGCPHLCIWCSPATASSAAVAGRSFTSTISSSKSRRPSGLRWPRECRAEPLHRFAQRGHRRLRADPGDQGGLGADRALRLGQQKRLPTQRRRRHRHLHGQGRRDPRPGRHQPESRNPPPRAGNGTRRPGDPPADAYSGAGATDLPPGYAGLRPTASIISRQPDATLASTLEATPADVVVTATPPNSLEPCQGRAIWA